MSTLCNPLDCSPIKLLCPWNSPGKNWSVLPFPSPGDLPNPTIEPRSPTLQADSLPYKPPGKGANFEQTPRDDDRHHGQGSLACWSPCGHKESDMTEQLNNPYLWCFLLVIFYPVTPYSALWPLFLFVLSWIQSLQLTIVVTTFIMMVLNKLCLTVLASIMNIFFSRRNVETKKNFFCLFWMQICWIYLLLSNYSHYPSFSSI